VHQHRRRCRAALRRCAKGSPRLSGLIEGLLARTAILPLEAPADGTYVELRARLAAIGRPIDANDLLVAAHALTLGLTLVTANTREFARIDGLPLENWLDADRAGGSPYQGVGGRTRSLALAAPSRYRHSTGAHDT
jgi:tRNA(fMet)-specific endonuclease VapC